MTEQAKKVRWGILGAARINRRMIPGLKLAANAELVAITSRDAAKAQQAAAQWEIPVVHPSYEALLADPQLDAVYIPLPNTLHAEWTIKAAQAGKHVLCEKPLALTPQDVERIREAAQANNVLAMEAFMYRFHPQQHRVRELLGAGAIGEPRVLRASFAFTMASGPNIRLEAGLGGGATWDVGCYGINVARWMFRAEPQHIVAEATFENGVDASVAAILDFGDGRRAVLDYGINYGRRSFYELIGTKGSLSVENMWQEPNLPGYLYLRTDNGLTTEEFGPTNQFQLEAQAFSAAVQAGHQTAPYPLEDSLAQVEACLSVLDATKA